MSESETFQLGDEVIASTMDMFVEQPDVRGIFSHYDCKGFPHLFCRTASERAAYGVTRKFDLVRRAEPKPVKPEEDLRARTISVQQALDAVTKVELSPAAIEAIACAHLTNDNTLEQTKAAINEALFIFKNRIQTRVKFC